jgi:carboxymethylenebutenolidase
MNDLNPIQIYFVEEFYEDYRAGLLNRRSFIRRLAYITGGMAAATATMTLLGCAPSELPDPTGAIPPPEPSATRAPAGATATTATVATASATAPVPSATAGPPDATQAPSTAPTDTAAPQLEPVPGAQSPFSVPEGDPAVTTRDVGFESQGEEISAYLARPAGDGVYPGLLVCHENRGLNAHIRDVARRFAKEGYVALAIDLLAREGGTAAFDPDEVPGLLGQAGVARHVADFVAGFGYLRALPFVDGERIGMTGYCFGGGITWQVVTVLPELRAAVPFYGLAPDLDKVPDIEAAVLGVYAGLDQRINAGIEGLEAALKEAGVTYEIKIYPGVNHAFHNDTSARYDETQATQAWRDTLAWFERYV